MKTALVLATLLLAAAGASAQPYKWVDKNGRVQYGDMPPPGASATPLRAPSGRAAPPPASEESKQEGNDEAKDETKRQPLTAAEQEAEFRKRRDEAEQQRQKQAKAAEELAARKQNCTVAQNQLRTMESGQRIARTNAQGERYFLEDGQIAQETAKARQAVQDWCS
ncbi:MAG TPA: DUF4124 domain-containing protein [Burkholderiales bacterium]|nr:DUF4124 domain-containing protein [Burkholderiales bacterium]